MLPDARRPGPHLTQGEVQTTPNASVTPHQQQPPTQQPQPRHTTLPRLRPRTWTWMTPNAYLPRVCFGRRPAVRRKPHKSGRRPGPWHCRRPSVVTEGYIRWPPLPPTHLVLTPCRFRFTPGPRLYLVMTFESVHYSLFGGTVAVQSAWRAPVSNSGPMFLPQNV